MYSESTFSRNFSVSYQLRLSTTERAFAPGNHSLLDLLEAPAGRPARALVFIDEGIAQADPSLERQIVRWFAAHEGNGVQLAAAPERVVGGEAAKADLSIPELVGRMAMEQGLCRHSYIIAIGGGAVLDAVGLGAALTHRGVRLIRMPTTVLAQNDAGLGVKNGVNAFGNKNFFGTFQPPWAILNDRAFLDLLPQRQWRAGIAEAVKVAIIKDREFLAWIGANAQAIAERDRSAMHQLVDRCAVLHLDHITTSGDPFETGSSRPLDFGHWSAHRLEVLSKHRLCHGEAVAIGVAIDLFYAAELGRVSADEVDAVCTALETVGFRLWDDVLTLRDRDGRRSVLTGLGQFREHLGGELTLAMPDGLGNRSDIHEFSEDLCERALRQLLLRDRERRRGNESARHEL